MKKAVLISCFNYYSNRIKYIEKYLTENNFEVIYIHSNFDHVKKCKVNNFEDIGNSQVIDVPIYKKNISISRIHSHYIFSSEVYKSLKNINPDLIYCILPPNFLTYYVSKFKDFKPNVKLIYDVYDLWPETFPISKYKKLFNYILRPWGAIRDWNLYNSDLIITECNYYQELLNIKSEMISKTETLYLMKPEEKKIQINEKKSDNKSLIKIAYLGSINNIIDIDQIVHVLSKLNKYRSVEFSIIGVGEEKEHLLKKLQENLIDYIDFGVVYDTFEKQKILTNCDFAINMMKDSVAVGLTMKSIDYFQFGLPLINNIKGDTQEMINTYKVGVNIDKKDFDKSVKDIITVYDHSLISYKKNSRKLFEKMFSEEVFFNNLSRIFEKHIWSKGEVHE
ncbi:glycosyltransferase family 4 protein [Exiguobacterium acetylicum]|uniref:glycosyltransferase family 4 protein n=1 Tax=Exiguobacterium acetylicum TaxID=41170 RepID=UPI0011EC0B8F|nr:glycosyltransferase family 4 protein [Exiguobacterium acetylicum]